MKRFIWLALAFLAGCAKSHISESDALSKQAQIDAANQKLYGNVQQRPGEQR